MLLWEVGECDQVNIIVAVVNRGWGQVPMSAQITTPGWLTLCAFVGQCSRIFAGSGQYYLIPPMVTIER